MKVLGETEVSGDRRYPKTNIITTIVIIKNVWTDSNVYYYGSASLPPWEKKQVPWQKETVLSISFSQFYVIILTL